MQAELQAPPVQRKPVTETLQNIKNKILELLRIRQKPQLDEKMEEMFKEKFTHQKVLQSLTKGMGKSLGKRMGTIRKLGRKITRLFGF